MGQVTLSTHEYDALLLEHFELQRIVAGITVAKGWSNKMQLQFDSAALVQLAQKTKEIHLKENPYNYLPDLQLDVLDPEKHPVIEEVKNDETT